MTRTKFELIRRLLLPPRIQKRDFWVTLLPFLLWAALVQLRPVILKTHCDSNRSSCVAQNVLPIDRPGLGIENGPADGYSYWTQNASGVLAVVTPLVWHGGLSVLGKVTPQTALLSAGTDLLLFAQTWGWNGTLTETVRLIAQRARPFVYGDPIRARDPQNYVSFYSGHTSFAASACTCLLLILLSRGVPASLLLFFGLTSECLVISTAAFRVLAGRHFLSDVLAGAAMGTLVAIAIAVWHRPKASDSG